MLNVYFAKGWRGGLGGLGGASGLRGVSPGYSFCPSGVII